MNSAERRNYLRHPIQVPIKFRVTGAKTVQRSHTADLSEGGMRFSGPDSYSKGTLLTITLPIEDQLFRVTGQVVYCEKDPDSGFYRTGISFTDPAMNFKLKLAEEVLRIKEFRENASREQGRDVSELEAATEWIQRYAVKFAQLYDH